jgi:toxoflavin biosynthesis protein ToxD
MSSEKDTKEKNNTTVPDEIIKPPQMVIIPAGPFLMGTSDEQIKVMTENEDWADEWRSEDLFHAEQPQHTVTLSAFEIGNYPVSNFEYYSFIYNSGYRVPKNWIGFHFNDGEAAHPVTGVSKTDALEYCKWLSKSVNFEYRLPTEAEWEKAARGIEGRIYPWGDNFDPWRCNTLESAKRNTTPCGSYSPGGDSPYSVADMSGNVWEWTSSFMQPYPYKENSDHEGSKNKCIVRGGAWYYSHKLARCAARESVLPDYISPSLGFRLAHSL